jgi:uncharacterized protein (TIGR03435 family)
MVGDQSRMLITRRNLNKGFVAVPLLAGLMSIGKAAFAGAAYTLDQHEEESTSHYEFEVATIKPANPAGGYSNGVEISPDAVVTIGSVSLHGLISMAWDVGYWQVDTKDIGWMTKALYDIHAKAPEATPGESYSQRHSWFSIRDPRLRKMLQSLLLDRFQLKVHKEERTEPVYLLQRNDREKLKLTPVGIEKPDAEQVNPSNTIGNVVGRGFSIHDMSMPGLAKTLADFVFHRTVLDKTGLPGAYNFESKTTLTDEEFHNQDLNTTFLNAVREMGLSIKKTEGATEFLIVDAATFPSPN